VTIKKNMGPARAQPTRLRRPGRRYPSDLDDEEWAVLEPAATGPLRRAGPPARTLTAGYRERDLVRGPDRTGPGARGVTCPKTSRPGPPSTGYFAAWRDDGTLQQIHDQLREAARTAAGRNSTPTAAVLDSQSVRAADTVPKASRGWDNAKKVNGRKRHIAVDTAGLLLAVVVTAASTQDRDGAKPLLWNLRRAFPGVKLTWADGGYAGKLVTWAKTGLALTLEIIRRPDDLHTFQVLPAAGSSSAPSPGSLRTAPASVTTNACPPATKPWCCGPWPP
jgi:putative transposase